MACHESEYLDDFDIFAFEGDETLLQYDLVLWDIAWLHYGYTGLAFDKKLQKILGDRRRRLMEIDTLMQQGKTVVILMPSPDALSSRYNNLTEEFNYYPECNDFLLNEGISPELFDIFSFLPRYLEVPVRENAVKAFGNNMDVRNNSEFSSFWKCIKNVGWYNLYFLSPVGMPILYISDSLYSVASWYKCGKGNIFLIPATRYDDSTDYPDFVRSGRELEKVARRLDDKETDYELGDEPMSALTFNQNKSYVSRERIRELQNVESDRADLAKLVQLCKELNICYQSNSFYSTIMLVRSIIDHVPPIFGFLSFSGSV